MSKPKYTVLSSGDAEECRAEWRSNQLNIGRYYRNAAGEWLAWQDVGIHLDKDELKALLALAAKRPWAKGA